MLLSLKRFLITKPEEKHMVGKVSAPLEIYVRYQKELPTYGIDVIRIVLSI